VKGSVLDGVKKENVMTDVDVGSSSIMVENVRIKGKYF